MAQVNIQIGNREYELACRDGEEEHLRHIAAMVDRKATDAAQAMGGLNEARQLLLAALLLADELNDASTGPGDAAAAIAIERLADRMELLAERLEGEAANP